MSAPLPEGTDDEVRLLVLERVAQGRITEFSGFYFEDGARIWWHPAADAFENLTEFGQLELIYPPDSGVWRDKDHGPGELVYGVHVGLSVTERTRRVALTEKGLAEYKELCERQQAGG